MEKSISPVEEGNTPQDRFDMLWDKLRPGMDRPPNRGRDTLTSGPVELADGSWQVVTFRTHYEECVWSSSEPKKRRIECLIGHEQVLILSDTGLADNQASPSVLHILDSLEEVVS